MSKLQCATQCHFFRHSVDDCDAVKTDHLYLLALLSLVKPLLLFVSCGFICSHKMTAEVLLQSDQQFRISDMQSVDAVVKIQEAHQMIGTHLRHRMSDADASQTLPRRFALPNLRSLLSDEGQLSNSFVAKDCVVDCGNTESVVESDKCLAASQHLPLHEVLISNFEVNDIPFTLREESVFRQIVRNRNVEFCPDVAVLIEPSSSEALSWILPGDQLIAINDIIIKSKDEAWRHVSECKQETLKLSVRPLAELTELSATHVRHHGDEGPSKVILNSSPQHNVHVSISQWFLGDHL